MQSILTSVPHPCFSSAASVNKVNSSGGRRMMLKEIVDIVRQVKLSKPEPARLEHLLIAARGALARRVRVERGDDVKASPAARAILL